MARLELERGTDVLLLESGDALLLEPFISIPQILVDIAFATDAMAVTPTWVDVSADCRAYQFRKGRQHELDRMQSGQAVIVLDNTAGNYWPDNAGGTYYPNVIAGKKIRIRAKSGGVTYPRFVGFIDEWLPQWLSPRTGQGPYMVVTATDGLEHLANTIISSAGEAAELSSTRVGNMLDEASWPAADRDLKAGAETLAATGAISNLNVRDHLQKVSESELGVLFVAFDGDMTFHSRSTRSNSPYDTSLATFGNDPAEMHYVSLNPVIDRTLLYNEVRLTRTGGVEQSAEDTTSQSTYGKRTFRRTALLNSTDVAVEVLCGYLLARYKNATKLRMRSIEIMPQGDPNGLYPKVLSYDISSRITCRLDQASLDAEYFIEGVEESCDAAEMNWRTIWQLSDVSTELYSPAERTDTIRPDGADTAEFDTIVGGEATNWESVGEVTVDDATYVEQSSDASGQCTDLHTLPSLPAGDTTIASVTVYFRIRQSGVVGDSQMVVRAAIETDSSEYYGDWENCTTSWVTKSKTWTTNPKTSAVWTLAEVNALKAGYDSVANAPAFDEKPQVSWCYVVVVNTPNW
uniref:Putative tail protein n=1 Tax=viral metagenome TaxID=1070528 RepID=A0A6M3L735_9ZZZZ